VREGGRFGNTRAQNCESLDFANRTDMGATRENYENLLRLFENTCKLLPTNVKELNSIKGEIGIAIKRIRQFHLFELKFSEKFLDAIVSSSENFDTEQEIISKELYTCLGGLLYLFETVNPRIDYAKYLELGRTELRFEIVSRWNISEKFSDTFSMESLFFNWNKKWLNITSKEEYLNYKNRLRETKPEKREKIIDKPIPDGIYESIKNYFEKEINTYREFIAKQYPEIKDEFSAFGCNIRIYIIPQAKKDGDIIHQVNFYKNYDGDKVFVYPNYLDFISRFSNIEEIERKIDGAYIGLFNELNLYKYGSHFSVQTIYHELHSIFIKKASFDDLRDYLCYLLRGQNRWIYLTEDKGLLKIDRAEDANCKIFFDYIPNLEQLPQELLKSSEKYYEYVVFKVRPDRETIKFIENNSIKYFDLEYLGREQVNKSNGEMIHWFIKDRIKNISNLISNNTYSSGEQFLKRLENCPSGTNGWLEYESLCTEIFEFLFKDSFRKYIYRTQSYTHDNIFRRDLIINNNYIDSTSIWAQVKSEFNSNLIVVDFKNYSNPLKQNEFYLPSKYLNLVIGKFGIIFSRKGLGNSAKILQRRMFNRDKELILCLDDNDLQEMIREKTLGQDPSYRLENQKFLMYELD
jgi:hypothetical protein